jgi:hypothetical protein
MIDPERFEITFQCLLPVMNLDGGLCVGCFRKCLVSYLSLTRISNSMMSSLRLAQTLMLMMYVVAVYYLSSTTYVVVLLLGLNSVYV